MSEPFDGKPKWNPAAGGDLQIGEKKACYQGWKWNL